MLKTILIKLKSYQYRHLNFRLIFWVIGITLLGINVIASATEFDSYEGNQAVGMVLGIIVMVAAALMDYHFVLKFYWVLYALNILLLVVVRFLGSTHMGAQRWIDLGFFQLQPSELAKIFLILFMAQFLMKWKEKINKLQFLLIVTVLYMIPVSFIFIQPDLSTSIVIILTFCAIMYISGLHYKIIGGIFALAIPIAIVLVYMIMQPDQKILQEYQYNRIVGFYDENNEEAAKIRYQQENSVTAIGSGGLWGKGLNNDAVTSVKKGNFISEPQTDFIFAIVGEELGFVGCTVVIVLLALITFECFWVGAHAPDLSGKIICCAFGSLIAFQSFINIAVVTMLIPNTGLTLPFVSYGLSSLISMYLGIGFVLNVGLQRIKLF